jgi:hypothetical protein
MKKINALASHLAAWALSILFLGAASTWLSRSHRVQTPDWTFPPYIVAMLVWAVWIFGKTCSFRPFTKRKLAEIVAYSFAVLIASATGLVGTYIVVVAFLGGE